MVRLAILLLLAASAFGQQPWRSDLPWTDLASMLSPSAPLLDTSPADFVAECTPEFDKPVGPWVDPSSPVRTNYALIGQPSGLCVDHLFCAFEGCFPHSVDFYNRSLSDISDDLPELSPDVLYSDLPSAYKNLIEDTSNPSYNLPSKVLFPVVASDVVAAVEFAKTHGLELSVKNSGHHYAGASTKRDTLHLNMNSFTRYADADIGISECTSDSNSNASFSVDLSDQPCRLALARNKSAIIRLGGGENWDKGIRAVKRANEIIKASEGSYKYHIVTGAVGTVSPMGWTFQGGLPGTAAGRLYGFGVDQVLMLEMVLPNGYHVRFGPTEWETAEGYDVPKTLKVSGVCRSNPSETDEDKWEWEACPDDPSMNFDDLWFAVRGGGGGTWGVVTSIYVQLHQYLPLELTFLTSYICATDEAPAIVSGFYKTLLSFVITFFLDPTSIGITEAQSNACSGPPGGVLFCYGKDSAMTMFAAWKGFLTGASSTLISAGIPQSSIDNILSCDAPIATATDTVEALAFPAGTPYEGQLPDIPYANYYTDTIDSGNIVFPKKWILENIDVIMEFETMQQEKGSSLVLDMYMAFGGHNSQATSDQASSLSQAHRDGGFMTFVPLGKLSDLNFYSGLLPMMYNTSSGSFPGFIGSNHAGTNTLGPLKSDWSVACPTEWTLEERYDKCISTQEVIYGTELLGRLQSIKDAVDPNYMFDCNDCIGNKRTFDTPPPNATAADSASASHSALLVTGYFMALLVISKIL